MRSSFRSKLLGLLFFLFAALTVVAQQTAIVRRNVNLRSGPSGQAEIIELLTPPAKVSLLSSDKQHGYYHVVTAADGRDGWVWSSNISLTPGETPAPQPGVTPPSPTPTPSPGTKAGPNSLYPRPDLTPGATDPRVAQANVQDTICVSGYTKTVRPPVTVTNRIKTERMAAYGFRDSPQNYELDHFVPLELGGCPDCVTNLWPEAYQPIPGAHEKDKVENYLHAQVCSGAMMLQEAQRQIEQDWYKVYRENHMH